MMNEYDMINMIDMYISCAACYRWAGNCKKSKEFKEIIENLGKTHFLCRPAGDIKTLQNK